LAERFTRIDLAAAWQFTKSNVTIYNSEETREIMWFYILDSLTVLLVNGRIEVNPSPKRTTNWINSVICE
jgi:hypothetical protein